MNTYLEIFLSGILILFVAVFINLLAAVLGISTWYIFLKDIQADGVLEAIKTTGVFSCIFLFLIYPFSLGATGYLAFNYLKKQKT